MGESPIGRNCPVAAVVISSGGKGDQPAGSLEVKVSVGRATRSDPPREASKRAGCSKKRIGKPRNRAPREADCGSVENAERFRSMRRLASMVKELDACSH